MFEDHDSPTGLLPAPVDRAALPTPAARLGPERRRHPDGRPADGTDWRFELLNEVDYGIVVLDWDGRVLYVNQSARSQLRRTQAQRLERGEPLATSPRDASLRPAPCATRPCRACAAWCGWARCRNRWRWRWCPVRIAPDRTATACW